MLIACCPRLPFFCSGSVAGLLGWAAAFRKVLFFLVSNLAVVFACLFSADVVGNLACEELLPHAGWWAVGGGRWAGHAGHQAGHAGHSRTKQASDRP